MSFTQAKPTVSRPLRWKILLRFGAVLAAAVLVGGALRHISAALAKSGEPAGFFQGVLQGALMPIAMPNLLFGNNVVIYAQNNIGRLYNLGYTVGVNACGAIFFGLFFWRLNQWRKRLNGKNGG